MRLHRLGNAMNCDVFTYVLVENRTYVTIIKQRIIEMLFIGRYIIEVDSWYVVGYAIDAMCVLFIKYTDCGQIVHIYINMCVHSFALNTPFTHYVAKTTSSHITFQKYFIWYFFDLSNLIAMEIYGMLSYRDYGIDLKKMAKSLVSCEVNKILSPFPYIIIHCII